MPGKEMTRDAQSRNRPLTGNTERETVGGCQTIFQMAPEESGGPACRTNSGKLGPSDPRRPIARKMPKDPKGTEPYQRGSVGKANGG